MVVIEPGARMEELGFKPKELVSKIHESAGDGRFKKLAIAYFNVGQAENYRDYWAETWRAPTATEHGSPDFMIDLDPDGWPGNYPVAFWDARWHQILYAGDNSMLDAVIDAGFDGLYLDWILAYNHPSLVAVAEEQGVDPAVAMVELLSAIRAKAKKRNVHFVMIAQNGSRLPTDAPAMLQVVDGMAHEDLSFRGTASNDWLQPDTGGQATSAERTAELSKRLVAVQDAGLPVFTLDYAIDPSDRMAARTRSMGLGFVPFVTRTPLDRLPDHVRMRGRSNRAFTPRF